MPRSGKKISKERKEVMSLVDSYADPGVLSQKNALDLICPRYTTQTLPVIIAILKDIQQAVNSRHKRCAVTEKFLQNLLNALTDADKKQNIINPLEWPKIIRSFSKQKINEEILPLIELSKKITLSHSELDLWAETVLWFEGIYLSIHNVALDAFKGKLEHDNEGMVKPINFFDNIFYRLTGLTVHYIASLFHQIALVLDKKICSYLHETQFSKNAGFFSNEIETELIDENIIPAHSRH